MELTDEQRELVTAHMEYAKKGATAYCRRLKFFPHLDRDDVVGAAYLGLCIAALKFDPTRGTKFTTVGFIWIDQQLKRLFQKENRANGWAWAPTEAEKAAGAKGMQRIVARAGWPQTSQDADGADVEFPSPVVYDDSMPPDERRYKRALVLMSTVDMREAIILSSRLDGESLEVIGTRLGITRERVRQLEKRIIDRAIVYVRERRKSSSVPDTRRSGPVGPGGTDGWTVDLVGRR